MSRSNNVELTNPAKKRFEWRGSEGKVRYFDKNLGEKGQNVLVGLPFTFIVLDKLSTIAGFSDADQSGFWANEIRDIKKEPLTVRTKKGIEQTALYGDLAPTLNKGACYAQSVYIAYKEGERLEIGNLKIFGAAIGPWIDFCKGKDLYKIAVSITGATKAKKGSNEFYVPIYQASQVSEETDKAAIELDKELQEYMKKYFAREGQAVAEPSPELTKTEEEKGFDNLRSGEPVVEKDGKIYGTATPAGDFTDLPF